MKATAKQKALSSYKRNYKKNYDIVCNLSQDEIDVLYLTDNSKYKRYRRCLKNIEKIKDSGLLNQENLQSIHEKFSPQPIIVEEFEVTPTENPNLDLFCENCLRKQNEHIVHQYGHVYNLNLTMHRSDEISKRNKFRRIKYCSGDNLYNFYLCKECSNFLNPNINSKKAKSSSNTWPAFILTTLTNKKVFEIYGNKIWQLIPLQW